MAKMKVGDSLKTFLIEGDDIVIKNGQLQIVDAEEEICQCIERILTTRKEEFFLDTDHGLDQSAFKEKRFSDERLKLHITEAVLQEERIKKVSDIEVEYLRKERGVKIFFLATTEKGEEVEMEVDLI